MPAICNNLSEKARSEIWEAVKSVLEEIKGWEVFEHVKLDDKAIYRDILEEFDSQIQFYKEREAFLTEKEIERQNRRLREIKNR